MSEVENHENEVSNGLPGHKPGVSFEMDEQVLQEADTDVEAIVGSTEDGISNTIKKEESKTESGDTSIAGGAAMVEENQSENAEEEDNSELDAADNAKFVRDVNSIKSILSGVVEGYEGEVSGKFGSTRIYESCVYSKVKRNGGSDMTRVPIEHRIITVKDVQSPLAPIQGAGGTDVYADFQVCESVKEYVKSCFKRCEGNRNHSGLSGVCDYGALIERLCAGLCRYASTGYVDWDSLSGGSQSIYNRESVDGRVEAPSNAINIPYPAGSGKVTSSWTGIVGAALGCGSIVLTSGAPTDRLGSVDFMVPENNALVECMVTGLSELVAIMEDSKAGGLAIYSAARGFHSENRIQAETEEGGAQRNLYTYGNSVVPSGIVSAEGRTSRSWPSPSVTSRAQVRQWLDGMGLYTAAIVAIADPCEQINGSWYPTVVVAGNIAPDICQDQNPVDDEVLDVRNDIAVRLMSVAGAWSSNMSVILGKCGGGTMNAENLQTMQSIVRRGMVYVAEEMAGMDVGRCVIAHSWIEPQNIVGSDFDEFTSVKECNAIYVARNVSEKEIDMFQDFKIIGHSSQHKSQINIGYTMARMNYGICHLRYSRKGGSEYMIPKQIREGGFVLCGSRPDHDEDFNGRAMQGDCIDDYMWAHGLNGLCAIGESMMIDKGMMLDVYTGKNVRRGKSGPSYFYGQVKDMDAKAKIESSQPRIVEVINEIEVYECDINRNNMITMALSRSAYGLSYKQNLPQFVVSATGCLGDDDQEDCWRSNEPLRLLIEAYNDNNREEECYRRMDEATKMRRDMIEDGDAGTDYTGPERHSVCVEPGVVCSGNRSGNMNYEIDKKYRKEYSKVMHPMTRMMADWMAGKLMDHDGNMAHSRTAWPVSSDVSDMVDCNINIEQETVEVDDGRGGSVSVTREIYDFDKNFNMNAAGVYVMGRDVKEMCIFLHSWASRLKDNLKDNKIQNAQLHAMLEKTIACQGIDVPTIAIMLLDKICSNASYSDIIEYVRIMDKDAVENAVLLNGYIKSKGKNVGIKVDEDERDDETDSDSDEDDECDEEHDDVYGKHGYQAFDADKDKFDY